MKQSSRALTGTQFVAWARDVTRTWEKYGVTRELVSLIRYGTGSPAVQLAPGDLFCPAEGWMMQRSTAWD